jgi:hypothetical protein
MLTDCLRLVAISVPRGSNNFSALPISAEKSLSKMAAAVVQSRALILLLSEDSRSNTAPAETVRFMPVRVPENRPMTEDMELAHE